MKDENIARKIAGSLKAESGRVVEIGPGTGVLTKYLAENDKLESYFIETDRESVDYLLGSYPEDQVIHANFLKYDIRNLFHGSYSIIGNFPYNISSQIFFRILEERKHVEEVVCMIQKEVADRIASSPGTKEYGILSVLLQTYYDIELLFYVNPTVFYPPPKVRSAVIRFTRNERDKADCNEEKLFAVVKKAFNQRRKMLRNGLKDYLPEESTPYLDEILTRRAEQLGPDEFIRLTNALSS